MYIRNNLTVEDEKRFNLLMRNNATTLCVVSHEECFDILRFAPSIELQLFAYNHDFKINIIQNGARRITVSTTESVCAEALWNVYQDLERFFMMFDGHFLHIFSASYYENDQEKEWSKELFEAIKIRRLAFYSSADFTLGTLTFSLHLSDIVTSELLEKYLRIESEMDLIHHIALYNMADTGVTIDYKCAQIIELFEPLIELMDKYLPQFTPPSIPKNEGNKESKLKHYLIKVIVDYGQDFFHKELLQGFETIAQIFVNSRNRMAHIKAKEGKKYLNGAESALYAAKLSMLYRRVFLEILGIDYSLYKKSIVKCVSVWNETPHYKEVYKNFIETKVKLENG